MIDSSGTMPASAVGRTMMRPARETLADIVVGIAFELEGEPACEPGPETLPGSAGELHVNGCRLAALRDRSAWPTSPESIAPAVRSVLRIVVTIRTGAPRSSAACACAIRRRSRILGSCVLRLAFVDVHALRRIRLVEELREIEPLRLPVLDDLTLVEHLHLPDHLGKGAEAHRRHQLARPLRRRRRKKLMTCSVLADEALAQHRVLSRHPHRAGVEVTLAHHDAAGRDQRRGREAELVGAEHGAHHDVAAGADAAVDPAPRCARAAGWPPKSDGFSARPIYQGEPACLIEVSGEAPVPPSKPAMVTWSARALETPGGDRSNADSETSFTDTKPSGLTVLEVEDELRQILDRIDVVVRWRRNEARRRASSGAPWQ